MALLYHRNVAVQPWHLGQPAGMQHHLSSQVERLNRGAYLSHSWAERQDLPVPAGNEATAESKPVDLTALSYLLHYSVGGTSTPVDGGHHLRRHTASGGNLGSAEIYLMAVDVGGLASGLYHYVMVGHLLERLRSEESGDLVAALITCGLPDSADDLLDLVGDTAAVLVVVSAVHRLGSKYAERGYLYCLLDAGLVTHRLETLASRIGLQTRMTWQFDDERLAEVLGVDGLGLAPTMLIAWRRAR
jgi:SagB-type dehydrogenase family enzyme